MATPYPAWRRVGWIATGALIYLSLTAMPFTHPAMATPVDPSFSLTFAELSHGFDEPLVATAPTSADEDGALAKAIGAFRSRTATDDFSVLQHFLDTHPRSPWRLALLTNLGLADVRAGYFGRALETFERAWTEGRSVTGLRPRILADRAASELLQLHARLGHAQRLATLLAEMRDRPLWGSSSVRRDGARQALWTMLHRPGLGYQCGPAALRSLLVALGAPKHELDAVAAAKTGPGGSTMADLDRLVANAGLPHTVVRRTPDQPVPVPSIIHWKVDHYAAIVAARDGKYELRDPTFGPSMTVSRAAIDSEGSGYFLVPSTVSAHSWRPVGAAEASQVIGTGSTSSNEPGATTSRDITAQGSACGRCEYAFTEMAVSLRIRRTPLSYTPPVGPAVPVTVTYNQQAAGLPQTYSFYNFGPNWSLNWQSYIVDDPNAQGASGNGSSGTDRFPGGGGYIDETGFASASSTFQPETYDGSLLTLVSSNPPVYTRKLPDGSVETYAQSSGATSYPRYVMLSSVTDPYGNSVTLTYDSSMRLTAITDPTGLSTMLTYGTSSSLLVTKITDPFGRFASFGYDGNGRLQTITDRQGLSTTLYYNDGTTSVSSMKTPYGTTQFGSASTDTSRYVQALDPLGYTERLEYDQTSSLPASESSVPGVSGLYNNELQYRNTFYWDKHAYAVSQGSYSAARVRHWAELATNPSVLSNFLESEKRPLENRVWYTYPGPQATAQVSGTLNKPTTIARVLDNGTTQATQFTYLCGNITGTGYTGPCGQLATHTDPAGRKTVLTYSANRIDLSSITQWNGSGYDTVAVFAAYDTHNRPQQIVDAAGQVTSLVYTSREQLRLITDSLGEKTTLAYDPTTARLMSVTDANGKVISTRSYDAFGRVQTLIDSEGYQLGFLYDKLDRPTQTTFPDGSVRMLGYKMYDVTSSTDRQSRTTSYQWDSNGNLNSVKDPLTKVTKFGYWENGALASIDDPNGNLTEFAIDVEGRTTGKEYADGSVIAFAYEATISRLHSITDALQQVKTIGYTVDNRPASYAYTSSSGTTPNVLFGYDPYYPRRTSMTDGNGLTSWSYEPVGTLGALKVAGENPPFANSQIAYTYDALSRMKTRTVGGDGETFGYDPIGD